MPVKIGSVEVGPKANPGEGRARRCYISPDKLSDTPGDGVTVIYDILQRSARLYPNKDALGWRDVVRMIDEVKEVEKMIGGEKIVEKKTWSYFELSDYKYWTYAQLADVVKKAGSALIATGHTKKTIFNIYSATSPRWQVFANACASQGIVFATAYDSLGEEGLEHSINEPEVYGIFTNANLLGTLATVIKKTPLLQVVVYDGEAKDIKAGALKAIKAASPNIKIYTFAEFISLGERKPVDANPPQPDDLACIMYTSGSTGAPKGVLITNKNIVSAIAAVDVLLGDHITGDDCYIAYLPLAHIFEFTVEMVMIFVGAPMGYGTVKTLTDTSVRNCVGDIKAFKPTIMVGVPAVWELIRKGILSKVKAGGAIKSAVFNLALSAKKSGGALASIADAVVFSAVKQGTGGRLKLALSGGAPISRGTQEFLSTALVTVLQGYGMTESCAMCAILPPDFMQYGSVGVPVPSCEIKLVDCPEAKYFSTNTPFPQGEIWIRGNSVASGYYKRDDITRETINDEGWLKTGDVGQWNKDGTLSVIDRLKNLVKLAGGEYIALERLESIYKHCSLVANICLVADSSANRAMALVFPHELNLKAMCRERGIASGNADDLKFLCESRQVQEMLLKELNADGKKEGLKPLESLQSVILCPDEWTPASGLLTAAQKLQRKVIQTKFAAQIKAVYP